MLLGLRSEVLEPRWGFISCSTTLIAAYCVVVVVTRCLRTALSLVAADTMLSMSLLNDSMNPSVGIAPGGGSWKRTLIVVGQKASLPCAIPWMSAAVFAELKESVERREWYATETSHSSEMARPDRVAFLCASSQRVMNSGTCGSSTHQYNIPFWTPITSIAYPPVLISPRWLRRFQRVTCLKRVVSYFR